MGRHSRTKRQAETVPQNPLPPAPELPPPAAPATGWKRHALLLAALCAMALLAYSNSFRAGLIYDNYYAIKADTRIRTVNSENTHLILTQDYWYKTSASGLFRPFTTFSYQFNYAVLGNGERPAGYHWVNFALHAVNIALVYWLALLVFQDLGPAFAMAALWAVHPILTESVTNIVGRADLLSGFSVLAGLLGYLRSVAASGWRKAAWLLAVAAATTIGIFSKESGIVVLAVAPLYEWAFKRGGARTGAPWRWRARIPGYLALALPIAVYLQIRHHVLSLHRVLVISFGDNNLVDADFWTARLTAIKAIGKYLWLLVWPAHLSADYSFNQIPLFRWRLNNLEDWKAVFALAVCVALGALAFFCLRRARAVFFFVGFFFVALAPTANLALRIGSVMAERFLYLPSIGFAGCLVWAGWAAYRRVRVRQTAARIAAVAAVALLSAGYSARTFARNRDWRDEYSLWASAVKVCPASYKTHEDFARELMNLPHGSGWDRAAAEFERSIAIMETEPPGHRIPTVYAGLGLCYRSKGDALAGAALWQPGYDARDNIWYQKAMDTYLRGEAVDRVWDEVTQRANEAAGKQVGPAGFPPLYLGLGRLYMRFNDAPQALEQFDRGRRIEPLPEFSEEMANVYLGLGQTDRAITVLMEGMAADLTQVRLAAEVAQLYRQTAPQSCALSGNGLNLDCPLVHEHLCTASRNMAQMYLEMRWREKLVTTVQAAIQSLGCPAEMFR